MGGPSYFTGQMNVAKNEDWRVHYKYRVDWTVSGGTTNIQDFDLTGYSLRMQIRKIEADNTAVVTVSTDDSTIVITNPAGGEFDIIIPRERLRRLHAGDYVADLVTIDPTGYIDRLWEGKCVVVEGTTRQ
jgi:hypothetical protein